MWKKHNHWVPQNPSGIKPEIIVTPLSNWERVRSAVEFAEIDHEIILHSPFFDPSRLLGYEISEWSYLEMTPDATEAASKYRLSELLNSRVR